MNTPRRIRTIVVSVPVDTAWVVDESEVELDSFVSEAGRPRFRPSEMLPWSDPYIAGLVRKLQDEVRSDSSHSNSRITSEAEMPWNEPFEYECEDEPGFTIDETALLG